MKLLEALQVTDEQDLPAGAFGPWLEQTREIVFGANSTEDGAARGADVPCGHCTACCRASQFIHVEPDESAALARIPADLLFDAPGRPEGHQLMGFDEQGCCPMLVDDACTIYEHRPRACRDYDCRIFAAAGVTPDAQPMVAERTSRWAFGYADEAEQRLHAAVRAAATFVAKHLECFAEHRPKNAISLAIFALAIHEVFLRFDAAQRGTGQPPAEQDVLRAVQEMSVRSNRDAEWVLASTP